MKKILIILLMLVNLFGCSSSMLQELMQAPEVKGGPVKIILGKR